MPSGKSRFDNDDAASERPDHPDFWALSAIVMSNDAVAVDEMNHDEEALFQKLAEISDEVLMYMAMQRAMRAMQHFGSGPVPILLMSVWTDGFTAGVQWAKREKEEEDHAEPG
jgi:hypothetical protein